MISLGIIGTGGMANSHAQQYMKMKGVRMVACCDVVEDRVRQFAEKYGIPRWYTDYQRMLDEVTLDGLDNVTVDAAHAPVSLAAIAHGVPVFCEKPLATSLADARAMRNAARRRKLITMVNFSYRNSSGAQAAAAWVASGGIGRSGTKEGASTGPGAGGGVLKGRYSGSPSRTICQELSGCVR